MKIPFDQTNRLAPMATARGLVRITMLLYAMIGAIVMNLK